MIAVDEFVYWNRENRLRFSLAHETAHLILHRDALARFSIKDIEGYLSFQQAVDPEEYYWMERQADRVAALILVPPSELAARFQAAKQRAEQRGCSLQDHWDAGIDYVAAALGREFKVSQQAMRIRLEEDRLVPVAGQ